MKMPSGFDVYIEEGLKTLKNLEKWRDVAKRVKDIVVAIDPEARVYVFGSVVKGKYTAASDIDILVVTSKTSLKYEIATRVYREVDAPVELHVVSPREFEAWYKKFVREDELVEVN